jgi:hypothetical protein
MTGVAAFDHAFGMFQFDYMAKHPDINAAYDAVMAVRSGPETAVIAQAYDFGHNLPTLWMWVADAAEGNGQRRNFGHCFSRRGCG